MIQPWNKCTWCSKPLRWWQRRSKYRRHEHEKCFEARLRLLSKWDDEVAEFRTLALKSALPDSNNNKDTK